MEFEGVPAPWDIVLSLVVGPVGAFVAMAVMIYFLWKLFREEQRENRASMKAVELLASTVSDLKDELKIWREAGDWVHKR